MRFWLIPSDKPPRHGREDNMPEHGIANGVLKARGSWATTEQLIIFYSLRGPSLASASTDTAARNPRPVSTYTARPITNERSRDTTCARQIACNRS